MKREHIVMQVDKNTYLVKSFTKLNYVLKNPKNTISDDLPINGKSGTNEQWSAAADERKTLKVDFLSSVFSAFSVCRCRAKNLSLDNLINEFPEYFNHLPHRPGRGHGFIRKFQN